MAKERNLTIGGITAGIWAFALPLMLGNVMQQFYKSGGYLGGRQVYR